MKKIIIFFAIIIVIIAMMTYLYSYYKISYEQSRQENLEFERYTNKDKITGRELATIINKAIDRNTKNEIEKDEKGKYIDNNQNSINVDIKFIDDDITYNMERFYNNGIEDFVYYYGNIDFKCSKIEYHNFTNKIKYMKFEQITT